MQKPNEIDWMYFRYAYKNKGKVVDQETASAVNESIDRIINELDEEHDRLNSPEMLEMVDLIDDRLE